MPFRETAPRLITTAAALCLAASALAASGPSAGGLSSPNVEWIRHVPIAVDGVGGRLVGAHFYVNDQNKIMIFDVSAPEDPQLTGVLAMPQEPLFGREDLDTNGSILLAPNRGNLHVVDVRDKANPRILSTVAGAGEHTNSCVLDCTWAYGSEGGIVDLRDPLHPKRLSIRWTFGKPAGGGHDVTEVSPGIVLTATQPIMLLDARADPMFPTLLATGSSSDGRFIHTVRWARGGADPIMLAGGETNFQPRCHASTGAFMTWDARTWQQDGKFRMLAQHRMSNGTFTDGRPPANAVGCSAHWFEPHPSFAGGGIVAATFFEHGTRFLRIGTDGSIAEEGWFEPFAGSTGAAYWITDEIVYAVDYARGMDVLRFTGASSSPSGSPARPSRAGAAWRSGSDPA